MTATRVVVDLTRIPAARLPAFQLDRAKLDEEVLQKAVKAGCDLWRPAKVQDLELGGEGKNEISVRIGEEIRQRNCPLGD